MHQPLLNFSVDDFLIFDWKRLFAICIANNITVDCSAEHQDFVNDLVLSLLARQREIVASRTLPSVGVRDSVECGGDVRKDQVSGEDFSLPCSSGSKNAVTPHEFLDPQGPQEHGKLAMGEGGALELDLGGDSSALSLVLVTQPPHSIPSTNSPRRHHPIGLV
jgi:hypothetical protein